MNDIAHRDVQRAESLLRPLMLDIFSVNYLPDFPGRNGTRVRLFQVVFAVGPGEMVDLRSQVHDLFPKMLAALAQVKLAKEANVVSLCARRHCPDSKIYKPGRPFMFIEVDWAGAGLRLMCRKQDFSQWHTEYITYRNHFDADDVLTQQYSGQAIC